MGSSVVDGAPNFLCSLSLRLRMTSSDIAGLVLFSPILLFFCQGKLMVDGL